METESKHPYPGDDVIANKDSYIASLEKLVIERDKALELYDKRQHEFITENRALKDELATLRTALKRYEEGRVDDN